MTAMGPLGIPPISLGEKLREIASPIPRDEKIMVAIERAARRCDLSAWRAFDIWYGKAKRVSADEARRIADALDKKRREAARNELHELRVRLARLESRLATTDAEFHRETIDALGGCLSGGGGTTTRRG